MQRRSSRAFTLVEMLVVIGIIAVLAALLLPAINKVLYTARNAAIAVELNQLASAIESYKQAVGDYPPNFRDQPAVTRHIRKCYPKIDPTYLSNFLTKVFPASGSSVGIDEGESLVFWLSMTDANPRYPFLGYYNPNSIGTSPKRYYDFDQARLVGVTDAVPSYQAKYCKESNYIYIDSRSYDDLCKFSAAPYKDSNGNVYGYAEDSTVGARPYWSDNLLNSSATTTRSKFKPMNPSSFQIICAGQDGDYGMVATGANADSDVKMFPSGTNYNVGDKDNITNFSNGRTLGDNIP